MCSYLGDITLGGGRGLLVFPDRLRRDLDREIHPLEDRPLGRVALSLIQADDPGIAAGAFLEDRSDVLKEDADDIVGAAPGLAFGGAFVFGVATEVGAGLRAQ